MNNSTTVLGRDITFFVETYNRVEIMPCLDINDELCNKVKFKTTARDMLCNLECETIIEYLKEAGYETPKKIR